MKIPNRKCNMTVSNVSLLFKLRYMKWYIHTSYTLYEHVISCFRCMNWYIYMSIHVYSYERQLVFQLLYMNWCVHISTYYIWIDDGVLTLENFWSVGNFCQRSNSTNIYYYFTDLLLLYWLTTATVLT